MNTQADRIIDYERRPPGRRRQRRPLTATRYGLMAGAVAIIVWAITFRPEGGVEWSAYLFPLARLFLVRLYRNESVSAPAWYTCSLLQWVLVGAVIDLLRMLVHLLLRTRDAN